MPLTVQTSSQCASGQCEYDVDETQDSMESCETLQPGCVANLSPKKKSAMSRVPVRGLGRQAGDPTGRKHVPPIPQVVKRIAIYGRCLIVHKGTQS